jgi:hypothetical protein
MRTPMWLLLLTVALVGSGMYLPHVLAADDDGSAAQPDTLSLSPFLFFRPPTHFVNTVNDKLVAIPTWEHVALAVPPHRGHCGPKGAILFSVDSTPRIWRSSMACFEGDRSHCSPTSDVVYGSSQWPLVTAAGVLDCDDGTRLWRELWTAGLKRLPVTASARG